MRSKTDRPGGPRGLVAAVLMATALWCGLRSSRNDDASRDAPSPGVVDEAERAHARVPTSGQSCPGDRFIARRGEDPVVGDFPVATGPVRRREVRRVDPGWFDPKVSPFLDVPDGSPVTIPLFDGTGVGVVIETTRVLTGGGQSLVGRIPDRPGGRFLMTVVDGSVAMLVERGPGDRIVLNSVAQGFVEIAEIEPGGLPDCSGGVTTAGRPHAHLKNGDGISDRIRQEENSGIPASESLIDLLVVYGVELEDMFPVSAIEAKIELAVMEANDDFRRSGARVALRLVGLSPVEYAGGSNSEVALNRLENPFDGFLDEVHEMRDALGADLVCFIPALDDPFSNGIAYVLTDPDDLFVDSSGFSAIDYAVLTGINALSHEVGHNLGCQHDRENAGGPGLFPYSHGHRFEDGDGKTWRTIMAYRPGERVSSFSTPERFFEATDIPLGIRVGLPGESDNVSSLNRGAFGVSNYRLSKAADGPSGEWINLSTRGVVGSGGRELIAGFVVEGAGRTPVLIRAISASLRPYGVADVLARMRLSLHHGEDLMGTNTGWLLGPDAAGILESGWAPSDPTEAALVVRLASGAYTAVLSAGEGAAGIGLIEAYGLGGPGPAAINLSARGYAGSGMEALISGFVLRGEAGETQRVLVRALGPSLAALGIENLLHDPVLALYSDRGTRLLANDDWDFSQQRQAIVRSAYAPSVRRESAMLIDLPPGIYTVVVTPFEAESGPRPGYALIEAYLLKPGLN